MENKKRLETLYAIARQFNLAMSKGEFAELIGIDNSSLSHALREDGRVNTGNVIMRAEHALTKAGVPIFDLDDAKTDTDAGNESGVCQRVRILIKHNKQNSKSLSKELDMTQQSVWNYLNAQNKMSLSFVERLLAHFPDVSAEWVMRGVGRMYHDEHYATATETEAAARPCAEQPSGQGELVAALRDTIAAKDELIAELKKRCATLEGAEAEKCGIASK